MQVFWSKTEKAIRRADSSPDGFRFYSWFPYFGTDRCLPALPG